MRHGLNQFFASPTDGILFAFYTSTRTALAWSWKTQKKEERTTKWVSEPKHKANNRGETSRHHWTSAVHTYQQYQKRRLASFDKQQDQARLAENRNTPHPKSRRTYFILMFSIFPAASFGIQSQYPSYPPDQRLTALFTSVQINIWRQKTVHFNKTFQNLSFLCQNRRYSTGKYYFSLISYENKRK